MYSNLPEKTILCVAGNIGIGKSTLLKNLEKKLQGEKSKKIAFVEEPVDRWLHTMVTEKLNLLGAMYSGEISPTTFQLVVVQSRFFNFFSALVDPEVEVVVVERSPWDEKFVFADTNLNEADKNAYNFMFDSMMQFLTHAPPLNLVFLYLKASRDVLSKRITKRGRPEEANIDVEYLDALEKAHGVMLEMIKAGGLNLSNWRPNSVKTEVVDASLSELELCNLAAVLCVGRNSVAKQKSLGKYEGALTRTDSQSEAISAAEELHEPIAARAREARAAIAKSREASPMPTPFSSPKPSKPTDVPDKVDQSIMLLPDSILAES
jgi:deoxyadenosine/deoxycytidine kinase